MPDLRLYGTEANVSTPLVDSSGDFLTADPTIVTGDVTVYKDTGSGLDAGSAATNIATYSFVGGLVELVLTAAEMQAERIIITFIDTAPKAWMDTSIIIHTGGNASALHSGV